ncbi:Glycosyltransferase involved in cell wall bisynthesis, partial [Candidatus Electrothrix marina]
MKQNKHILFISPQPFFQWRGSPIRVRFVLKSLSESGHTIDLLTLPFGEDEQIPQVRIIRVANFLGLKNISIGPSAAKLFFDAVLLFKAFALVRRRQYDVVHGIEEAGFIAVLLAKLFCIKAIFEKHSDPLSYRKGWIKNLLLTLYAFVEKLAIKQADLVICTGPGLSEQVREMGTSSPVHTISDMASSVVEADPKKIAEIGGQLRRHPDEILVTYVGSFAIYQGVDLMFATIPKVCTSSDRVRFVIIGGNEDEIARRRRALEQQGVADQVTFLGIIAPDTLPNYLAASDIFIAPRQSGTNTPLKILDYYKAGRAVVATDVPSNKLILNKTTALFAAPDADSFAENILKLVADGTLRERLGRNGRLLYEKEYNFSHN